MNLQTVKAICYYLTLVLQKIVQFDNKKTNLDIAGELKKPHMIKCSRKDKSVRKLSSLRCGFFVSLQKRTLFLILKFGKKR